MTALVATLNIVLGLVYFQYGTMTLIELRRNVARMGLSRFGVAWVAMAFTCGPHHFVHGIHTAFEGRAAGALDLVTVAVAFPAGVTWFLLRLEAFRGGRGDRFVQGSPLWVLALPSAFAAYVTAVFLRMLDGGAPLSADAWAMALPNLLLIAVYGMVALYVIRTQVANRSPLGGWSLSGLALAVIFPTCAVMHGVFAYYALSGRYGLDTHNTVIDWLAVPAGLYFLWVVRALYRGDAVDWNRIAAETAAQRSAVRRSRWAAASTASRAVAGSSTAASPASASMSRTR